LFAATSEKETALRKTRNILQYSESKGGVLTTVYYNQYKLNTSLGKPLSDMGNRYYRTTVV
jgi:hypothetical protein